MILRFSPLHALLAVSIFLLESCIALNVHDEVIRPLGGDAIVVMLVWAAWRTLVRCNDTLAVAGSLFFCYAIELAQYFHFVDVLGLGRYRIVRIVLGSSFDVRDLAAYTLGAAVLFLLLRWHRQNGQGA